MRTRCSAPRPLSESSYPTCSRGIIVNFKNCKIMLNVRTTSPDGYSECGYTKVTSDTCNENTQLLLSADGR